MRRLVAFFAFSSVLALVLMLHSSPPAIGSSDGLDLDRFRWRSRLLLVFAPDSEQSDYVTLERELRRRSAEVAERDLRVLRLFETGVGTLDGEALEPDAVRELSERFGTSEGVMTVALIGKDGGVKLQREGAIDLDEVFELIDSMPMRRNEMRRRPKPGR